MFSLSLSLYNLSEHHSYEWCRFFRGKDKISTHHHKELWFTVVPLLHSQHISSIWGWRDIGPLCLGVFLLEKEGSVQRPCDSWRGLPSTKSPGDKTQSVRHTNVQRGKALLHIRNQISCPQIRDSPECVWLLKFIAVSPDHSEVVTHIVGIFPHQPSVSNLFQFSDEIFVRGLRLFVVLECNYWYCK